jgi:arginase
MKQILALIGVPSSAGAHWPGQEQTPRYLREAGLVDRLAATGLQVMDLGDLPLVRFRPDRGQRQQQNLSAVVDVAQQVAGQVDRTLQQGAIPLVVGGDCTLELGVVAGFLRHTPDLGLLYFDGHVDLNTPATSSSGILDSMGVAHLIGAPGTVESLSRLGGRFPMLPVEQIALFGYNLHEMNPPERDMLAQYPFVHYPLSEVQGRPAQAAGDALAYLESRSSHFVVHFDVDVIDFTDFPIADVPQFHPGLKFQEALACLAVFAASPNFGGITITEFNPNHAEAESGTAAAFIEGLAQALAGILTASP